MQSLVVCVLALATAVFCAPQQVQGPTTPPVPILRSALDTNHDGNYAFSFETGNSIVREEQSEVLNPGQPNQQRVVRGRYSYVDPEGRDVVVSYIVGEDGGFRAEGNVLPKEPEIPEAIQIALARNAAEEAQLNEQQRAEVASGRYVLQ
ncbi:larval cuticle protein 16/17-like [Schistocerca nitens]|uniref:larval cuticle protein 16/17-like n=1 Tax=Schistocerca cancellata TaxID=274614 RepID=UPI0021199935|nr:larval cuticle protein 16/17-like [Schistocerca cancellata]XP_049793215.1 larval cuticle protein 16/17-like [Schistocerca nitens]XP_049839898.1 larval cuticle protein 16/17-like [Schistocerca gregaria]